MPQNRFMACISLALIVSQPILAAPAAVPAQQSKCEISSNKYWATHKLDDTLGKDPPEWPPFDPVSDGQAPPPNPVEPFRQTESGITFTVEMDGRHIIATDNTGKVLWRRNPFVDFGMCPYRSPHPYIVWIGPPGAGYGAEWHIDSPATARPDAMTNANIVKMLSGLPAKYPVPKPRQDDRFLGLAFDSSQFGYLNIRNGDFYFSGQN